MGLILHLLEPSARPDSTPNFLFILEAKFLEIIRKKKKNFLYHGLLYINHKSNGTLFNIKLEFSLFLLLSLFFKINLGKFTVFSTLLFYLGITLKTQETSSLFSFILTWNLSETYHKFPWHRCNVIPAKFLQILFS